MFRAETAQRDKEDENQPIELKDAFQLVTVRNDEQLREAALSCDQLATISHSDKDYTLRFIDWRTQAELKNVPLEARLCPTLGIFGITHLLDTRFLISINNQGHLRDGYRNDVINSADKDPMQEAKRTALIPHPFFNPPTLVSKNEIMITQSKSFDIYSLDDLTVPYTTFTPPGVRGGKSGSLNKLTGAIYACGYRNGFVTLFRREDKEFKQLGVPTDLSNDRKSSYDFESFGPYLVRTIEYPNIDEPVAIFKFDGKAGFVQTCTVPRYRFIGSVWLDSGRLIVKEKDPQQPTPKEFKTMMLDPETGEITATIVCGERTTVSYSGEHLMLISPRKGVAIYKMKSGVEEVLRDLIHSGLSLFKIPRGVAMVCFDYVGGDVQLKRALKK